MASPPVAPAVLPFAEARGCKDWLNSLPLTNVSHAQGQVLEALKALDTVEALERLKCLELMRDKVAFMLGEQRSRYFGRPLPLAANDERAWANSGMLLAEMEAAYRKALQEVLADRGELRRHAALVAQRIVRYIGAQMMLHMGVCRRFDPQLWVRLHRQYADAESQGFAEERVRDSLEGDESGSSVAEAYAHVVLLQAAYLSELTLHQMEFAEALVRLWVRKVPVRRTGAEGTLPPTVYALAVDFDKPIGARPLSPRELTAHHRILDIDQLSLSMRRRIFGLKKEEDVATLKLPPQASAIDALQQLERLHRLWCEGAPPRPPARVPAEKEAALAFGAAEIHYFLTEGRLFEQPGQSRELTRQEKQDIEVFGQVSARTQTMRLSEFGYATETWGVIDEMLGAWRLMRPENASKGLAIGKLLAMRISASAPFFLGMVSALVQETDGRIVITVTLFPGKADPIAVRGDSRGRAPGKWQEGFRLPALPRLNIPASLVVPSGLVPRGRGVEVWTEGAPKTLEVKGLLDRGADFGRVALA